MSLDAERTPAIYPVLVWRELAQRLHDRGDGALARVIRAAMDRRRLDELAPLDLTDDERARVMAVLAE